MDFYSSDPVACLLDSSIGVTIYDENFELIAWNDAYCGFGITPKPSIKTRLNLCDTYTLASRLGVFGSDEPKKLARVRFEQALNKTAPTSEILHLPNGGTTIVRRMFLPNIGVAALFSRPDDLRDRWAEECANVERKAAQLARREVSHAYNNHLTKILAHLELAKSTGDTEHLRKAEDLCCTPVRPR